MVLTRDGRVMSYGTKDDGTQTGYFTYDVWDPNDGVGGYHLTLPNGTSTDIFCSAQILLPTNGNILIAGGDTWTGTKTLNKGNDHSTIFQAKRNNLKSGELMNRSRWYSSVITLANGESYIQGGDKGNDHPEIRGLDGQFRLLDGADTSKVSYFYPRNWVAPDGKIFGFSNNTIYTVDPSGTGSFTKLGNLPAGFTQTSTDAMFATGKILELGGGPSSSAITNAVVIDINGSAPAVTATDVVPAQLHWATATALADGKVLVTGGSKVANSLSGGFNQNALIWDPANGHWTVAAETASGKARLYHSGALLLPDGSVLVGGGGAPGPQKNLNAEIYYPPYLFNADGSRASRPSIVAAPGQLKPGNTFQIAVGNPGEIARVTLVKTGSVTHGHNMDQRFMDLAFQQKRAKLVVTAPKDKFAAPPGFYMLFVIDRLGVPSPAKVMWVKPG